MRVRPYNPYAMVTNTRRSSFKPEARIYSREEYTNLTPIHKSQVHELKLKMDGQTFARPHQDFRLMKEQERLNLRLSLYPPTGSYNKHSAPRSNL